MADARLVAVADSDPRRCAALAPGVAAYPSVDALIAAGDVDAVVVATPAAAHVPAARAVARAGLPALVEKPPAPDADGARELAALRPAPWIGFNRRFLPGVAALRGREPAHLRVVVHYRRASWQSVEVHDDALLDLGPHAIDLVHWIGSSVRRVRTTALSHDRCKLELELELAGGTASVSCATDRIHRELVEARDESGALVARDARGGVARAIVARLRPPTEHALVNSLAAELEAFCAAVRGGDPGALATAEDGVAAMAAVDAARRSRGVWVVPS